LMMWDVRSRMYDVRGEWELFLFMIYLPRNS
jgi:hypothetical protein